MKILVVGKVTDNQISRLREEAEKRGHTLANCSSYDLFIITDNEHFLPQINGWNLNDFNLIYLLTVGDRKWEWYLACQYLSEKYGTKIVDQKVVDPNYKIFFSPTAELKKQVENGINFPKTAVVVSTKTVADAISSFTFPVIVKTSHLQRGLGVSLVNSIDEMKKIIMKNKAESPSFLIREFIENDGDIRVFVIGYKALGAMKRTPREGDFRSNISRGGFGAKFDLDSNPQIKEIAEKMALLNQSEIAGVDIIIHKKTGLPYVLEINRGPQFAGLEKFTGINAAKAIIKHFESRLTKN